MTQRLLAVCFDFGDTLVDQGSEIKDETLTSLSGDLIPGADDLLRELKRRGYPLAIVSDGRPGTYHNVLSAYGLYPMFDVYTISELLGCEKPDPRMFHDAMGRLGISQENYGRVIMVGDSLERDVKGANGVGMISVWLNWTPRLSQVPADDSEAPRFIIKRPLDLLAVIESLEAD